MGYQGDFIFHPEINPKSKRLDKKKQSNTGKRHNRLYELSKQYKKNAEERKLKKIDEELEKEASILQRQHKMV